MSDAPVIVRQFPDSLSAHAARVMLEANGIDCILIGDDAGGMQPALGYIRGVRLAVREGDARRAIELLDSPAPEGDDDAWMQGGEPEA